MTYEQTILVGTLALIPFGLLYWAIGRVLDARNYRGVSPEPRRRSK